MNVIRYKVSGLSLSLLKKSFYLFYTYSATQDMNDFDNVFLMLILNL